MFVSGKPFQLCLTFVGEARSLFCHLEMQKITNFENFFGHFSQSGCQWHYLNPQSMDLHLRIMSWVFCNCAVGASPSNSPI
jgi:hypothetical protein